VNKEYYVLLTGSKNNAGDFLIKYRAINLFKTIRPDRDIVDFNAWEYLDDEKLKIVNNAKALILMGGPALQKNMYPGIYKLRKNLDDIVVPIVLMGVGWKSMQGQWKNTYLYELTNTTIQLLDKIEKNEFFSSVRDYHTLNVLQMKKYSNILMTGCPAYYDIKYLNSTLNIPKKINKVAFSLGVSFVESKSMEKLMQEIVLDLKTRYKDIDFEVVFHHSLDKDTLLKHNSASEYHNNKHNQFANWLEKNDIKYIDISGSAENLIEYYSTVDLHIGFRVHAHIFMNSISKYSILISEDGRAYGVEKTIGGIVLNGYTNFKESIISKILNRLFKSYDRYYPNKYLIRELSSNIDYEQRVGFIRIQNSRSQINNNFNIMKLFINQLP